MKVKRAILKKQMEEENLLFSRLVSLHEVTKILASTQEPPDLNNKFLDYSLKMSRADGGVLLLYDYTGKLTIAETSRDNFDRSYWLERSFVAVAKWVASQGEPLALEAGARNYPAGLLPLPVDIQSLIAFPLKSPTRTIGVLILVRTAGKELFSNLDVEIVNVLSSQASISIENVRLYHNIRDNYLKTIRAFALAVEAKDEYTHGHSENVIEVLSYWLNIWGSTVKSNWLNMPDYCMI